MGFLDIFKKKPQAPQTPVKDDSAPGWDAITAECERIYPEQKDPKHYGTLVSWKFGGNDPLPGISIYDGGAYWHFVTYGLSELYEKETDDKAVSGYGMEFTFRLSKDGLVDEEAEIRCICGILQAVARITFTKGEVFLPYEYLYTSQTQGIDVAMRSNITGFITVPDTALRSIDTPNGRVDFTELVGVTDAELGALRSKELDVRALYEKLGSDVTSYRRESAIV